MSADTPLYLHTQFRPFLREVAARPPGRTWPGGPA